MSLSKLDHMLIILHDTLPYPDWQPEPHASEDLLAQGVVHLIVRRWLGLKNQHTWEMTAGLENRRS